MRLKRLSFLYRSGLEVENNSLKSELKLLLGESSRGLLTGRKKSGLATPKDRVVLNLLLLQERLRGNRKSFNLVNKVILDVAVNDNLNQPLMASPTASGRDLRERINSREAARGVSLSGEGGGRGHAGRQTQGGLEVSAEEKAYLLHITESFGIIREESDLRLGRSSLSAASAPCSSKSLTSDAGGPLSEEDSGEEEKDSGAAGT